MDTASEFAATPAPIPVSIPASIPGSPPQLPARFPIRCARSASACCAPGTVGFGPAALAVALLLWRFKKLPEPVIVAAAAAIGLVVYPLLHA